MMELGDRLFALTESTAINEINPDSLTVKEKVGKVRYGLQWGVVVYLSDLSYVGLLYV